MFLKSESLKFAILSAIFICIFLVVAYSQSTGTGEGGSAQNTITGGGGGGGGGTNSVTEARYLIKVTADSNTTNTLTLGSLFVSNSINSIFPANFVTNLTSASATITGQGTHTINIEVSSGGDVFQASNSVFTATNTFTKILNLSTDLVVGARILIGTNSYPDANVFLYEKSRNQSAHNLVIDTEGVGGADAAVIVGQYSGAFPFLRMLYDDDSGLGSFLLRGSGVMRFDGSSGGDEIDFRPNNSTLNFKLTSTGATIGTAGSVIKTVKTATASLGFGTILLAGQVQTNAITITGMLPANSECIIPGWPSDLPNDSDWRMNCTATDVVTVTRIALVTVSAYTNTFRAGWMSF